MSNSFQMNPLSLSGSLGNSLGSGRSNTPPQGPGQQSQSSPNSFLQGLSSRLRNQQQQAQQQQQIPLQPGIGGIGGMSGGGRSVMDIFDSANIPGPASSFGFSSASSRGGGGNNNFGIPVSSGPPSTFDINEFPSLSGGTSGLGGGGGSGGNSILPSSAPGSNRPNYVGQLVKDVHNNSGLENNYNKPSFDMNDRDFPALPGSGAPGSEQARAAALAASLRNNTPNDGMNNRDMSSFGGGGGGNQPFIGYGSDLSGLGSDFGNSSRNSHFDGTARGSLGNISNLPPTNVTKSGKKGILTTKEGKVSNIPMGMVTDQFGMIGLLTFIRAAETEQNIVTLALGTDLTSLKLDLNSSDTLYSTFPGPWSEVPLKPHEIDYPVPSEYLIHHQVRDKLASIREKLSRYGDDTLFFLFYMFPNDLLQIGAANELFGRDWRYHKDDKVWVTRAPGMPPVEKTTSYERGTYYFFDPTLWRRVAKEFHLDYDRLENKPASAYLQSSSLSSSAPNASHSSSSSSSVPSSVNNAVNQGSNNIIGGGGGNNSIIGQSTNLMST